MFEREVFGKGGKSLFWGISRPIVFFVGRELKGLKIGGQAAPKGCKVEGARWKPGGSGAIFARSWCGSVICSGFFGWIETGESEEFVFG